MPSNLSERKRAGAETWLAGEQARTILESITDAFCALDRDWRFLYVNRQAEALLGRASEDLLGKSHWEEYPPTLGSDFERHYRRAVAENVAVTFETFYPPHDRWYEVHAYPSPDVLSVYFRDTTERRRAEERERRLLAEAATSNAKFRAFFEQGPLFAGIMHVDGTVLEANRLSLEACGYTREEVVGKPFWECPWWSRSAALVEQIRAGSAQAAAGETFRVEMSYFVADGGERMVDLILLPIKDEAGRVLFLAPTGTDITHRRQLEDHLRRLAADLSDADRRKDEFLATLAHELRNPLAPIRNGLQILKLAGADGKAAEQARVMMERQLAQMVRLVDDLLDVSRITRDNLELRRVRVELSAVVASAVETSRPLIEAGGHHLTVSVPPAPLHLDADPTRLAQVFSNLLNNAAKYTGKGGRIRLTAERQGGEVVVAVTDTGVGIPSAMLPKVFDMFTQVDRTLERSQGGLGIGLTLVRQLVELHGGTVSAFSEGPGRGSELVVRLPVLGEGEDGVPPPASSI